MQNLLEGLRDGSGGGVHNALAEDGEFGTHVRGPTVTPAPGTLTPSSGPQEYCIDMYSLLSEHKVHNYKQNKIFKKPA